MTKLSIIIPVYNEETFVEKSLKRVTNVDFPIETEFIVVDDGSTDNTLKIIGKFINKSKNKINLIRNKTNNGKGSAIIQGLRKAKGDIVTFHDADLEYDPNDLKILLKKIVNLGKNYAVYGSRFMKKQTNWAIPSHYIGNRFLSLLISILYWKKIDDMETCYKLVWFKDLKEMDLESKKFEIEPEITAKLLRKGVKIKEIPITYNPRTFENGKKISCIDGIKALFTIIKYRFFMDKERR
jgi:glycosyltransferase involved in cell wall biosynthesis